MKKIFSIIAIALVFALLVPSIPSYAADNTQFIIRCRSTVPEETSGNGGVLYGSVFPDGQSSGDLVRQYIIEGLATFDFTQLSGYDYYFVGANRTSGTGENPATVNVFVFWFNSSAVPIYATGNSPSSTVSNSFYAAIGSQFKVQSLYVTTSGYGTWSTVDTITTQNNVSNNVYGSCTAVQYVLDTNFAVNSQAEIVIKSGIVGSFATNDVKQWYLNGGYEECTDLFANTQGYNAQGEIVDGSGESEPEIESNSNHLYFQSCDLGFCEPTGITNFESFGGAYLYCKYTVDNWIVNHINDYQLRFNVVSAIGSEQNNFSYTMRLDRNGYVTIPFSSLFVSNSPSAIPINRGFAAVVSPQKLNNDYNIAHLYSVANENVPNFVSEVLDSEYNYNLTDLGWSALRGGTLKYIAAWVSDQGTISMNNLSNWAEGVAQSFNPYILRVEVKLISGEEQSSGYAEKFDLYTGDQTTVDTGGLVNPDPFVPDVDQDDGDLPSAPQDPNSTTPSTIVYTGGVWQGTINGVIGYDPGYRELKEDVDKDPDGNFTQYLDPMKNQTVGSWFLSFVNDMPGEMKALLITGTGVGIFFGIYRFIRRG